MKPMRIFAASVALIFATVTTSAAGSVQSISRPEIAARHCGDAWAKLQRLDPQILANVAHAEIDPQIDPETTEAFNKFGTAVIIMRDYVGTFVAFSSQEYQSPANFKLAQAKYDLLACLSPDEQERNLIVAFARKMANFPKRGIRPKLFGTFDKFKCMQWDQASEQVFQLDPTSASFSTDFEAIKSTTMKSCN